MLTPSRPASAEETAATRSLDRRVMWGLGAMVTLTVIGVVGFMLVAADSLLDALYMTVVALSTVGYIEIVPLDQGGRLLAIALIIAGISAIGYTCAVTVEYLVSGHLLARVAQRRKEQATTALRGHYIVCGSGRVGQDMIENLGAAGRSVVTIDRDQARCERAEGLGVLTVCGNAASVETRRTAGIDRATAVLVSMGNNADNLYTVLSARATAPHISVIARANTDETVDRLAVAGATHVFSPYAAGAQHMVSYVLKPNVAGALSELLNEKSKGMTIKEVAIGVPAPTWTGRLGRWDYVSTGWRSWRLDATASSNACRRATRRFRAHDVLVMIGPPPNTRRFAEPAGV